MVEDYVSEGGEKEIIILPDSLANIKDITDIPPKKIKNVIFIKNDKNYSNSVLYQELKVDTSYSTPCDNDIETLEDIIYEGNFEDCFIGKKNGIDVLHLTDNFIVKDEYTLIKLFDFGIRTPELNQLLNESSMHSYYKVITNEEKPASFNDFLESLKTQAYNQTKYQLGNIYFYDSISLLFVDTFLDCRYEIKSYE